MYKSKLAPLALALIASSPAFSAEEEPTTRNDVTVMVGRVGLSSHDDATADGNGFSIGVHKEINKIVGISARYSRTDLLAAGVNGEIGTFGAYPEFGYRFDLNNAISVKPYVMVGIENNILGYVDYSQRRDFSVVSFAKGLGIRAEFNDKVTLSIDIKRADLELADDYYVDFTTSTLMLGVKF
ncbi:porin family protein [Aliivibrio fischeri]|uniref:porin family protein n=1 Tax=Aliivibrio fischeri TaxID=668 RepID=UPI001F2716F0|nr:porin family protein [Aliivibrio fischeri]MCE7567566.1 porin family protein [Aliivibrio fischeri]